MGKYMFFCLAALLFALSPGCATRHEIDSRHQVEVAPVEIKPIHITIDINIRVQKDLDDFFGDLDEEAKEIK